MTPEPFAKLRALSITITTVGAAVGVLVGALMWMWAQAMQPWTAALVQGSVRDSLMLARIEIVAHQQALLNERTADIERTMEILGDAIVYEPGSRDRDRVLRRMKARSRN